MKKENAVILFREDLHHEYLSTPIDDLIIKHFKPRYFEEFRINSVVLFVDKDLTTKILKNRYGR